MAVRTPTIVQSVAGTYDHPAGGATETLTLASPVTAGNSLLALWQARAAVGTLCPPNGFEHLQANNSTPAGVGTNFCFVYFCSNVRSGDTAFPFAGNVADTGTLVLIELADCDFATEIQQTAGITGAFSTADGSPPPFATGLMLGFFNVGDNPGGLSASLTGLTAGWSTLSGYSPTTVTQFNTGTPPVAQAEYKLYVYTESITDIGTATTLAATSANASIWDACTIMLAKTGSTLCAGGEPNNTTGWGISGTGTYQFGVTQKRTSSGGAQGIETSAAAQNKQGFVDFLFMPQEYFFHSYVNVVTAPGSTQPILKLCGGNTASHGIGLWYNQATTKFSLQMYAENRLRSTSTSVATQDGTSVVANTWYRFELQVSVSTAGLITAAWWIDGVAQTSITYSQPAAAAASVWYHPPTRLSLGNIGSGATATFKYYYDDIVLIGQSKYMAANPMPMGAVSVAALQANGHGTDVNNASFQDDGSASWGTPDYTRVADAFAGTGDYCKQVTAGKGDYIELTLADPAGTYVGCATMWANGVTQHQDMHVALGADEYQVRACPEGTPTLYFGGGFPTATPVSAYGHTDAYGSDGVAYSNANLVAMLARWGYSANVATPPRLATFFVEVASLPILSGGDHWGWAEGSDSSDSWQMMPA